MSIPVFRLIVRSLMSLFMLIACLTLFVYLINELKNPDPEVIIIVIVSSIAGSITTAFVQSISYLYAEERQNGNDSNGNGNGNGNGGNGNNEKPADSVEPKSGYTINSGSRLGSTRDRGREGFDK